MFESCRAHLVVLVAASVVAPAASAATGSGSFTSSDPQLNSIWTASVRTAHDMLVPGPLTVDWAGRPCAIDVATAIIDGVVRDRCPYVGDEAVIDRTLDASTPDWPVQRAMLVWFAQHQHADGSIPASPLLGGGLDLLDYDAYWVQVLHAYVLYSGDVATARLVWPHVLRLLDRFYPSHTRSALLVNPFGANDYAYVSRRGTVVAYYNAGYVLALKAAVQLANWVGDVQAVDRWQARASATSKAFGVFWDARAGAFSDTTTDRATHPQDGNAFAVLAGVASPRQALRSLTYLRLHNTRDYGNTIVDTDTWSARAWGGDPEDRVYPFMSYFEVAARFTVGLDASAFNLLRREWGYMLRVGPGTTWETIGPFGGPPSDQHPSYDAGWSSGAAPALTQYVLGVAPASPGFKTFTVVPHPYDLAFVRGTVPTPHGPIRVSWQNAATSGAGRPVLHVSAPPGTSLIEKSS